jgi:hypothetical protein
MGDKPDQVQIRASLHWEPAKRQLTDERLPPNVVVMQRPNQQSTDEYCSVKVDHCQDRSLILASVFPTWNDAAFYPTQLIGSHDI